jgi:hypothetical protein
MTDATPHGKFLLSATGRKLQIFYVATALLTTGAFLPEPLISENTWTLLAVGVAGLVSVEKLGGALPAVLRSRRSAKMEDAKKDE